MQFDPVQIGIALATSAIGYVYFSYGKKMAIIRFIVFGVALMTYSYLVTSIPWLIGIGILLAAMPHIVKF